MGEYKRNIDLIRKNKSCILFNDREMKAINSYCSKYGVGNKSKFMRQAILASILARFDDDYPTLF